MLKLECKMKIKKYIPILLILFITTLVSAQVKFEARVSKKKLGVNEHLKVEFIMNKNGDNFTPPSFEGFTVVGGPSQNISNNWVNGVHTFEKTYTYFLAPNKRGAYTIGQAKIQIEDEIYKTLPISVQVTTAIQKPKDPNDPNYIASQKIHFVTEISNPNPYLNEAISVVYKLYVAQGVRIDLPNFVDKPVYDDFWSQDVKIKDYRLEQENYKDENYNYVILKKTVLYPQKTGKLKLKPFTIDVPVMVQTNKRDFFGRRMMENTNVRMSSVNRVVNVKPLPEKGKPIDFTGAVGDFSFKISTTKKELDASESFQAKVQVSGSGNLKLFKLPTIQLPSSLEVYEPEHNESVATTLRGMKGTITDTYTIVPQFKGKYPIPTISFSYFDLKTQTYKRLTSDEIVINVLNGPTNTSQESDNSTFTSGVKQPVMLSNEQFAFIKTKTKLSAIGQSYFFKTKLFWSLLSLPFLAIPLAVFIRKTKYARDADVVGNKVRKADKLARKYLKGAKKALGNKEAFYIALEKALHNYLKAKLNIETSELSKDRISYLLKDKGVEASVVSDFINIFENCELARYTPITAVTMQEDYDKAAKTISLIDKQAR